MSAATKRINLRSQDDASGSSLDESIILTKEDYENIKKVNHSLTTKQMKLVFKQPAQTVKTNTPFSHEFVSSTPLPGKKFLPDLAWPSPIKHNSPAVIETEEAKKPISKNIVNDEYPKKKSGFLSIFSSDSEESDEDKELPKLKPVQLDILKVRSTKTVLTDTSSDEVDVVTKGREKRNKIKKLKERSKRRVSLRKSDAQLSSDENRKQNSKSAPESEKKENRPKRLIRDAAKHNKNSPALLESSRKQSFPVSTEKKNTSSPLKGHNQNALPLERQIHNSSPTEKQKREVVHSSPLKLHNQKSSPLKINKPDLALLETDSEDSSSPKRMKQKNEELNTTNNYKNKNEDVYTFGSSSSTEDKITSQKQPITNKSTKTRNQNKRNGETEKRKMNSGYKKSVTTSSDVRRSNRKRIKPLQRWRGEKLEYRVINNFCHEIVGIIPGYPIDDWSPKAHKTKQKQAKHDKSVKKPEKFRKKLMTLPFEGENIAIECFSTPRFELDETEYQTEGSVLTTCLEVPGMVCGYLDLRKLFESHSNSSDTANLIFFIVSGMLEVTIHDTTKNMSRNEFFFVPKGITYKIKNLSSKTSRLTFTKYDR